MNAKLQKELIDQLAEICEQLGWSIGVPADDENQPVEGLIVGTEEFIMSIVESMDAEASMEVFSKESTEEEFSEPVLLDKKKLMH